MRPCRMDSFVERASVSSIRFRLFFFNRLRVVLFFPIREFLVEFADFFVFVTIFLPCFLFVCEHVSKFVFFPFHGSNNIILKFLFRQIAFQIFAFSQYAGFIFFIELVRKQHLAELSCLLFFFCDEIFVVRAFFFDFVNFFLSLLYHILKPLIIFRYIFEIIIDCRFYQFCSFQLIRGEDSPTSSRGAAKWREESPTPHQTKLDRSNDASKRKWVV